MPGLDANLGSFYFSFSFSYSSAEPQQLPSRAIFFLSGLGSELWIFLLFVQFLVLICWVTTAPKLSQKYIFSQNGMRTLDVLAFCLVSSTLLLNHGSSPSQVKTFCAGIGCEPRIFFALCLVSQTLLLSHSNSQVKPYLFFAGAGVWTLEHFALCLVSHTLLLSHIGSQSQVKKLCPAGMQTWDIFLF